MEAEAVITADPEVPFSVKVRVTFWGNGPLIRERAVESYFVRSAAITLPTKTGQFERKHPCTGPLPLKGEYARWFGREVCTGLGEIHLQHGWFIGRNVRLKNNLPRPLHAWHG